jgi:hypothetical protein
MPVTSPEDGRPAGILQQHITLQDILRRRVPLEWFECVALVASLCSALDDPDTPAIPRPDEVVVTPAGVLLVRGSRPRARMEELPRLLNSLLEYSAPPAPLRLFVLHAISSGAFPTPRSFGQALAYYERPGRAELVQSAHGRYLETPDQPDTPDVEVEVEPPPLEDLVEEPAAPPRPRRRTRMVALVAVLVCASAVPLLFGAARWQTPTRAGERPGPLATAAVQVREAAVTVTDALAAALGRTAPAPVDVSLVPVTPRRVPVPRPDADAAILTSTADQPSGEPAENDEGAPDPLPGVVAPEDPEIYSPAAGGVIPPVLADPIRLPAPPGGGRPGTGHVIELVVSERGTVDRVQLLSPASRMTDMMLLSAAKSWIFEPARKDGHPVKYRLTFTWVTPGP